MPTIVDRLKVIIDVKTPSRGRFTMLEKSSTISAVNWKTFWYGRQRPNHEMIQTIARLWPEYAFWLVTGLTDNAFGHVSPYDDRVLGDEEIDVNMLDTTTELFKHLSALDFISEHDSNFTPLKNGIVSAYRLERKRIVAHNFNNLKFK